MNWCNVDLAWAYGDLLGSIYRRTRSLDRAYDVLHDALVRLAMANRQDPVLQPHAYLRRVVRSVLADHGRDAAHWLPFPDGDDSLEGTSHPDIIACRKLLDRSVDPQSFAPSPEHLADLRERLRAAQRIMDCLPPRCREVFWLFRIEGYTQPEIAAKLEISLKTVEYHIKRAIVELLAASSQPV